MNKLLLFILSWFVVSFGTPDLLSALGPISAAFGYGLFFLALSWETNWKKRFFFAALWEMGKHLVQMSWMVSHPFLYIWAFYILFSLFLALPIGGLAIFVTSERLKRVPWLFVFTGTWVLIEWSRIFILAGFVWDYAGVGLAAQKYSFQLATLGGVYFLSFWVILTNLFFVRACLSGKKKMKWLAFAVLALCPYVFGIAHYHHHDQNMEEQGESIATVLVQTQFPLKEEVHFESRDEAIGYVMSLWQKVLFLLKEQRGKKIDLIVLPEYIVPYSTFLPVFRHDAVKFSFTEILGQSVGEKMPRLDPHLAYPVESDQGTIWMVNNAFWVQAISNIFDADVIVGLEDHDVADDGRVDYFTSAFTVLPEKTPGKTSFSRYEKRVLVPMGEYIPYAWLRSLAKSYGISGSFTCGSCAKVHDTRVVPAAISICYEETFGDLMREARLLGCEVLVNITNDGWFPNSRLPKYHLEHARLRTVEMGVPLVRACNTGVTCAVNSLGDTIKQLEGEGGDVEHVSGSLYIDVPKYHYVTLYTYVGDQLALFISILSLVIGLALVYKSHSDL